jgi:hypothetical protein
MSQNLAELIFQFCVAFFLFQERRKEKKKREGGRGLGEWLVSRQANTYSWSQRPDFQGSYGSAVEHSVHLILAAVS